MSDIASLNDRLETALAKIGQGEGEDVSKELESVKAELTEAVAEKEKLNQKLTETEAAQSDQAEQVSALNEEIAGLKAELEQAKSEPAEDTTHDLAQLRADREDDLAKVNDILKRLKPLVEE